MAGTKKTIYRSYDYRQCDDFAAYLNHMARQGWHFREWRAGLVFEQGAPEDSVYAVEVFSGATEYDVRPEPKTREFAEYCQAAGWELIDAKRKLCIFKRLRPDALPIMTDGERLENIVKAVRPEITTTLITPAMFTVISLMDLDMLFQRQIFDDASLIFTLFWPVLLVLVLVRLALFYRWKSRCDKHLEEGKRLFFGKSRQYMVEGWFSHLPTLTVLTMLLILLLLGETWMVMFYLGFAAILWIGGYLISRFRPDALSNQIIQVLGSSVLLLVTFCVLLGFLLVGVDAPKPEAHPPLTYEEMGIDLEMKSVRSSDQLNGTFGSWEYYNLDYGNEYLFYDVYRTEYGWILDKIWESETKGKANEIRQDCTHAWGAEEAFRNHGGDYLVRYEDAIWVISISLEENLTQEQIAIAIAELQED